MLFEFTKEVNGKKFDFVVRTSEAMATAKDWRDRVEEITINGDIIEKEPNRHNPSNPYYSASFKEQYIKTHDKVLCLEVRGDTKKKICKILGLKIRENTLNIVIDEFRDVWAKMEAEGKTLMEKLAAERQAQIDAEYENNNTEIEVHRFGGLGWGSRGYGDSTRGKRYIELAKRVDNNLNEIMKPHLDHTDWGDYSVDSYYKLTIKEFESIVLQLWKETETKNEQRDIIRNLEEIERDNRRATMKVEILKEGRISGGDGTDFYARVEITDIKTGEKKEFNCRNIFDCGYVVNPLYPVIEGAEGGIEMNGYWDTTVGDKREKVKITDVERRMLDYLYEFSPIDTGIRM